MTRQPKRFRKVVEWDGVQYGLMTLLFSFLAFVIIMMFFWIVYDPTLPIKFVFILIMMFLLIDLDRSRPINREVYWEEVK